MTTAPAKTTPPAEIAAEIVCLSRDRFFLLSFCLHGSLFLVVYYESLKRELKTKTIFEYRCDERLIKLPCCCLHKVIIKSVTRTHILGFIVPCCYLHTHYGVYGTACGTYDDPHYGVPFTSSLVYSGKKSFLLTTVLPRIQLRLQLSLMVRGLQFFLVLYTYRQW